MLEIGFLILTLVLTILFLNFSLKEITKEERKKEENESIDIK